MESLRYDKKQNDNDTFVRPMGHDMVKKGWMVMKIKNFRKSKVGIFFAFVICTSMIFSGCGKEQKAEDNKEVLQEDTADKETSQEGTAQEEAAQEKAAPDFTAEVNNGSSFTLSEQKGKVILLNFWATWCGPCVEEMPAFEKLYQEYGDEVAILAVNFMEDKSTVDQFVEENEYTFPIAYDENGEMNSKYPTDGIPYTLVIGKDGIIKKIYEGSMGADAMYEEYKSAIDSALEEE